MSDSLRPHVLQHTRLSCLLPTPGTCSNSCPVRWWCWLKIGSSSTIFLDSIYMCSYIIFVFLFLIYSLCITGSSFFMWINPYNRSMRHVLLLSYQIRKLKHRKLNVSNGTHLVKYSLFHSGAKLRIQFYQLTLGWRKHKLESRLPGEISITLDMQMTPPSWQKVKN